MVTPPTGTVASASDWLRAGVHAGPAISRIVEPSRVVNGSRSSSLERCMRVPPAARRDAQSYIRLRSGDRATCALAVQALGGDDERVGRMAAQPPGLLGFASGRVSCREAPRAHDRLLDRELLVELAVHDAPFRDG